MKHKLGEGVRVPRRARPHCSPDEGRRRGSATGSGEEQKPTRAGLNVDVAKRLAQSSKQLLYWKEKRNRLIREAYDAGGGVREIARATGLSHPAVINILGSKKGNRMAPESTSAAARPSR